MDTHRDFSGLTYTWLCQHMNMPEKDILCVGVPTVCPGTPCVHLSLHAGVSPAQSKLGFTCTHTALTAPNSSTRAKRQDEIKIAENKLFRSENSLFLVSHQFSRLEVCVRTCACACTYPPPPQNTSHAHVLTQMPLSHILSCAVPSG